MDKKLTDALDELSEIYRGIAEEYETDCNNYWNNLSKEDQQKAFYSVIKRVARGELIEKRSYRGILYDVFGWGPEAYGMGMECNFMELHNAIDTEKNDGI